MEKSGLVVEGGGMRGIYAAGVLDVLMENGVTFDGVMGVSAGAIHGVSFVSEQKGRSIRYYKKYSSDWRFMSVRSLLLTGDLVGEEFCYREIPEKLDPFDYETFRNSDTEMYCVCSNLATGKPEYLRLRDMKTEIDILRASASMPYVSKTVCWNGMLLLDGGCTDSIPVRAFRKMGFGKCVVVQTRHDGYLKMPESVNVGKIWYRQYPAFAKAMERRYVMYNRELRDIKKLEESGEIFVIRPSQELTIGRMEHDPTKIEHVYNIGKRDANRLIIDLVRWLG